MRLGLAAAFFGGVMFLTAQQTLAQELFFFPAQGQTQQQQNQDFGECHAWAVQQSGFDPMVRQSGPPKAASQGGALRGAARGAAGGAVVGALTGNAGRGAAMGAAGGGLIGGFRRADQQRQQDTAQRQHQQQQAAGHDTYNRALGACMQGRGYSVG